MHPCRTQDHNRRRGGGNVEAFPQFREPPVERVIETVVVIDGVLRTPLLEGIILLLGRPNRGLRR